MTSSTYPGELVLSIRDHDISFVVPAGTRMEARAALPGGALICGEFTGELLSQHGSIVIAAGATVQGTLEADNIYIEGDVSSSPTKLSILIARNLIAAGAAARIHANLFANVWNLNRPKLWGQIHTFDEAESLRLDPQHMVREQKHGTPALRQRG